MGKKQHRCGRAGAEVVVVVVNGALDSMTTLGNVHSNRCHSECHTNAAVRVQTEKGRDKL